LTLILAGLLFLSFINGSPTPKEGLQVGDRIPEINYPLVNGQPFDTETLRGKMVLLDFWASYDAPSRIESFEKKNLLESYKNSSFLKGKGFEIVSISLDRFRTPLLQAIDRDELDSFFHICDFKGRESQIAKEFNNQYKLTNYLIDGDGRIVAASQDIEKIRHTIEQLAR
jgi:peroxiredoxin